MANLKTVAPNFAKGPPATSAEIETWEKQLGRRFPVSYREFLQEANGGEGPIGELGYAILWPLQALQENLNGNQFDRYAPHFLPIGSDGGGEALVIDYTAEPNWLGYIPFSDLKHQNFVPISTNFWDVLRLIGEGRAFD